jgi:hypothetical protein
MMEKVFLWGTGAVATNIMENCLSLDEYEILGFIDNNQGKAGTSFYGKLIHTPDILKTAECDRIVVATDSFDAIREQIMEDYPDCAGKVENQYYFYKNTLLKRYRQCDDEEINVVLSHIREHGLGVYNYPFMDEYCQKEAEIFWDAANQLYYVYHFNKKMYFSEEYTCEKDVLNYYRGILAEQDQHSPHRYLDENFNVEAGDVVIDAGVAEGNFALEVIDRVKKIYLIEADPRWIRALELTFKDYMDKVTIISGFLTSYDECRNISLDSAIGEPVNFIKMDIEGSEYEALLGANNLIRNSDDLRLAICCYHSDFDRVLIEKYMDDNCIEHCTTKGYMWFPYLVKQNKISTQLNRGIVRGIKIRNEVEYVE